MICKKKPKTRGVPAFRGQLSVELLLAAAISLAVFLALMQVYAGKQQSLWESGENIAAKKIAFTLSRAINAVYSSANGTSLSTTFGNESATLGQYVICANNSVLEVRWRSNSRSFSETILANRVFSQGGSAIVSCTFANASRATIVNNNGDIYIESA